MSFLALVFQFVEIVVLDIQTPKAGESRYVSARGEGFSLFGVSQKEGFLCSRIVERETCQWDQKKTGSEASNEAFEYTMVHMK